MRKPVTSSTVGASHVSSTARDQAVPAKVVGVGMVATFGIEILNEPLPVASEYP